MALLLALVFGPLLAAAPAPAPARRRPRVGAVRPPVGAQSDDAHRDDQPVPAPQKALSASDFQSVAAGQQIPDSSGDATGFAQAVQAIYGPSAVPCAQLGLKTGDLIWTTGTEIDVLVPVPAPALACGRRWVPNPTTFSAMTSRYPRTAAARPPRRRSGRPCRPGRTSPTPRRTPPASPSSCSRPTARPPPRARQTGPHDRRPHLVPRPRRRRRGGGRPAGGPHAHGAADPPAQSVTVAFEHTGGPETWTAPGRRDPGHLRRVRRPGRAGGHCRWGATARGRSPTWPSPPGRLPDQRRRPGGRRLTAWRRGLQRRRAEAATRLTTGAGGGGRLRRARRGFSLAERLLVAGGAAARLRRGATCGGADGYGGAGGQRRRRAPTASRPGGWPSPGAPASPARRPGAPGSRGRGAGARGPPAAGAGAGALRRGRQRGRRPRRGRGRAAGAAPARPAPSSRPASGPGTAWCS